MLKRHLPLLLTTLVLMFLFSSCGVASGGYTDLPTFGRVSGSLTLGLLLSVLGYLMHKGKIGGGSDRRMIGLGLMCLGLCIAFWPILSWLLYGIRALIGFAIRIVIIAVIVLFVYFAFFRDKS